MWDFCVMWTIITVCIFMAAAYLHDLEEAKVNKLRIQRRLDLAEDFTMAKPMAQRLTLK